MLTADKKIVGNVIITGGPNGELNFENGGEVIGNVGDEQNAIKVIHIQQGIVKFANTNLRTIDISGLFSDHDRLIRLQALGYQPNYKTKIVVDDFNISDNAGAQFNDAVFIGKTVPNNSTMKGGNLEFKDDVWLNNAIEKADKIKFAANKFAVLANNIKAQDINAEQAKVIIANDMSIKGSNFTAPGMLLDLGDKTLTFGITGAFKGTLTINTTYNSAVPLESGRIKIAADGKMLLSEIDKIAINVFIAGEQPVTGTKYRLVQPEDETNSDNNIIDGLNKDRPKTIVQLNKDQTYFTEWEVDADGKNLFLYSTLQNCEEVQKEASETLKAKEAELASVKAALAEATKDNAALVEELAKRVKQAQDALEEEKTKLVDLEQAKTDAETNATRAKQAEGRLTEDLAQAKAKVEIEAKELAAAKAELKKAKQDIADLEQAKTDAETNATRAKQAEGRLTED
ncbi:unnamed protein product, partial [Didymodactylos carnosus]